LKTYIFNDKELIEHYLLGDESSLEVLIRRHKKSVFIAILKIVKDKQLADDLFQDTFFKVINLLKLGKYTEKGKFLAWVIRIAHNIVMDYYRNSNKIQLVNTLDDEYDIFKTIKNNDLNAEEEIIKKQIHSDIRHLIQYLPEEQKEVVFLRHYNGMSFKEIAEKTNVNINTAIARMRYALLFLRKFVKEKEIILTK